MKELAKLKRHDAPLKAASKNGVSLTPPAYGLLFTDSKPVQKTENKTGIPDELKSGVESLSDIDMSDVKVHYNSSQPAQLNAHAYAQGNQIHVAPGQEKHLPHEVWHVVQQKQGRVKPTMQLKDKVNINDDVGLEREADVMGGKAISKTGIRESLPSASFDKRVKPSYVNSVSQLIPDKDNLYYNRLVKKSGPAVGVAQNVHLINYVLAPANAASVGVNVQAAVNAAVIAAGGPGLLNLMGLRNAINNGLAPSLAAIGQYGADTAHNAALTAILTANPFVNGIMQGNLHNAIPKQRGALPAAGALPAFPAGTDDRVLEAADVFNRATNMPAMLPPVAVNPIEAPHAAMDNNGQLDLGWAAARGNIVHEFGHHLENNLGPADFTTLHNFLTARTQLPLGGAAAMPALPPHMMGMRHDAGYFFEHHPGYQIDMPEINAGGMKGRRVPQTLLERVGHTLGTPYNYLKEKVGRVYHATPLRYFGLIGSGVKQQFGRLLSKVTGRREPRNWGGHGVENFFVHNANNQQLSYSTANHGFGTPWYTGSTEYLSTTTEFINRPSHFRELVKVDPLRVALFLYLANRPQYLAIRAAYVAANPPPAPDLNDLIHVVN
jgi:hypothetical protein